MFGDGVAAEDLYPLDVDCAFAKLDEIKDHLKVWWTVGVQPPNLLSTNEVSLASAWSGRITEANTEGAPVNLVINEGIIPINSWAVVKGLANKGLAMKFIAFTLEPKHRLPSLPFMIMDPPTKQSQQVITNSQWWVKTLMRSMYIFKSGFLSNDGR